jgi:hypothetical protein
MQCSKSYNYLQCLEIHLNNIYTFETWSLTLREERRLRVFENRVLRKIVGPKRDEVTGEWRVLHNEELNDPYCSPNIVRGKGKAVPLQAWSGPEGSKKLRFPAFMTTAQDSGKVVSLTHRPPLPPRKYTWYSFLLEAESTPGP